MKRILVIDDSEANLLLINSIFEDDPEIEVALENNSTRALKTVRKQNPGFNTIGFDDAKY
jgi:CheY-like chemotaxis protein